MGFFIISCQKWRENVILGLAKPTAFVDLGYGVLDTAKVETSCYCLKKRAGEDTSTVFVRLIYTQDKPAVLRSSLEDLRSGDGETGSVYILRTQALGHVTGSPFAYWVSNTIRRLFKTLPAFENENHNVRAGIQTSDDFRFVRLRWEVPPLAIAT